LIDWLAASKDSGWKRDATLGAEEADLLAAMGYTDPGEQEEELPWGQFPCDCEWCQASR
jgi:hypothetical protein